MRKSLCVIVFIVLTILFVFILPDGFIYGYVSNNIAISGDGEVAMDNYESVVLLIKLAASAVLSLLIVWMGNRRFK
ncbi:hypothetical protein [Serratia ficaria]|uniref:hypothetical protein n=1 Tax=Serratia ficaria TaxID=61651 RepID=UPI0021C68B2F|nr:hypothetical protein [Serratia ficaria]